MKKDEVELASSWSLRQHYTSNLHPRLRTAPGRHGIAICNGNTTVYDDVALFDIRPDRSAWTHPRSLCKRCERQAALYGYQVRKAGSQEGTAQGTRENRDSVR